MNMLSLVICHCYWHCHTVQDSLKFYLGQSRNKRSFLWYSFFNRSITHYRLFVIRFHWTKCLAMQLICDLQRRARASSRWNTVATVQRCRVPRSNWCNGGRKSRDNGFKPGRSKVDIEHSVRVLSLLWPKFRSHFPLTVYCRIIGLSKFKSADYRRLLLYSIDCKGIMSRWWQLIASYDIMTVASSW